MINYFIHEILELNESFTCFKELSRSLYLSFNHSEINSFTCTAKIKLEKLKERKSIGFWVAARHNLKILSIKLNNKQSRYLKLKIGIFKYFFNYLLVFLGKTPNNLFEIEIIYKVYIGNHRDQIETMLENFISKDYFHLFCGWYPSVAKKLSIIKTLTGHYPFESDIFISVTSTKININAPEMEIVVSQSSDNCNIEKYSEGLLIVGAKKLYITNYEKYRTVTNLESTNFNNFSNLFSKGFTSITRMFPSAFTKEIDIYLLPIIAGGYGLRNAIIYNSYFLKDNTIERSLETLWHEILHIQFGGTIVCKGRSNFLFNESIVCFLELITSSAYLGYAILEKRIAKLLANTSKNQGKLKPIEIANRKPPYGYITIYYLGTLALIDFVYLISLNELINRINNINTSDYTFTDIIDYTKLDEEKWYKKWILAIPDVEKEQVELIHKIKNIVNEFIEKYA